MKVKIFTRLLTIVLILAVILPILSKTIHAADVSESRQWKVEEIEKVSKYIDEQIKKAEDKKGELKRDTALAATAAALNEVKDNLPAIINSIHNVTNGGGFDVHAFVDSVTSICGAICAAVGTAVPIVAVIGAAVNLTIEVIMLCLGGEKPDSELAQVEARFNESLSDIQDTIYSVEEKVDELSKQMDVTANRIVDELTTAMDNADAKQYVRNFILGTDGNFSYNQYKNYLTSIAPGNHMADTAYYAQFLSAMKNGGTSSEMKRHYDRLYEAIVENEGYYYSYIVGAENGMGKSIVQYYYDILSANPELIENKESNAEIEAILFAYDLYCTEISANELKIMCNAYQYVYMLANQEDVYYYGNDVNDFVTMADIEGNSDMGSINDRIFQRVDEIEEQFARDFVYIFDLTSFYLVEDEYGEVYEVKDSGSEGFGNVIEKQTIYLAQIPEILCEKFGIDANDFSYEIGTKELVDGVFEVDENFTSAIASVKYKDKIIGSLMFQYSKEQGAGFDGGSGTESDPYLISNASQFKLINEGLDKHYKLINDIDFNGEKIRPFGFSVNQNGTEIYKEFKGSLDGNGYTVKNVTIEGSEASAIFGEIGTYATVQNVRFENVTVTAAVNKAKSSYSEFYAGVVAGKNNGAIENVVISSCNVSLIVNNKKLEGENRIINTMVGGVAGKNRGVILSCIVEKTKIKAETTHDYGGNPIVENQIASYAGGISGVNENKICIVVVNKDVEIEAKAKAVYNHDTTVYPYVTAYVGGITAEVVGGAESLDNIANAVSYVGTMKAEAELDCKSSYDEYYKNRKKDVNKLVPGYSEKELEVIIGKEEDVKNAGTFKPDYDVDYTYGTKDEYGVEYLNSIYVPGPVKTATFKFEKNETGKGGISSDYYTYDKNVLVLSSDNTGTLFYAGLEYKFVYEERNGEIIIGENKLLESNIVSFKIKRQESLEVTANNVFLTTELKFIVNGKECEYEIIDIYGFDTNNELLEDVNKPVIVLFKAVVDDRVVFLTKEIPITVQKNYLVETKIIGLKDSYMKGTFSAKGLILQYIYAVGPAKNVVLDETVEVLTFPGTPEYGEISVFLYIGKDELIECKIVVICEHDDIISEQNKSNALSVDATCYSVGKDAYVCPTCKHVEYIYYSMTEHNPSSYSVEATCTSEGYTGRVVCMNKGCGKVLTNGRVIPMLVHNYNYADNNKHICANCGDDDYHRYTVEESIRLLEDDQGAKVWRVVYTFTCICKNSSGMVYTDEKIDYNEEVSKNTTLPSVVVSDGYVLNGGDEVVVYVQLVNNPGGINGAAFGIRYSPGLELVKVENGNIFEGSLIEKDGETNYGYNFVRAKGSEFVGDGNLLKLTFKVDEKATLGEIYEVKVVYGMRKTTDGKEIEGGFSVSGKEKEQYFATKSGTIKVVQHLPGDVNRDGEVNLLDAMEIAKFMTTDGYDLDEKYANVDLSQRDDGKSNIGINDIIAILQAISGGYRPELELRDQSFEITLNTNDPMQTFENIKVSIYDENNNIYSNAGLINLERDGYKFLGWYDKIYGGNRVDITDFVKYNEHQKKQTLYAQWELNTIVFEKNGATNDIIMAPIYYTTGTIEVPTEVYSKVYPVLFISDIGSKFENLPEDLIFELEGWNGPNNLYYETLDEAVADLQKGHYGKVTLTPKWSEKPTITFPDWRLEGYEDNVEWCCDKEDGDSIINPGINNEKIIGYDAVNDKYRVYSKHKLITFTIEFYSNGKYVGSRLCNVEKAVDLSVFKDVAYEGYDLSGWICNGTLYGIKDIVGYVSGAKAGDLVRFDAHWGVASYQIDYKHNYDNKESTIGQEANESFSYDVEHIAGFNTLSKTKHSDKVYGKFSYIKSWTVEGKTDVIFYTVKDAQNYFVAHPQNATLVANWDIPKIYTANQGSISVERAIVDWRNYKGNVKMELDGVKEVYFLGNASVTHNLTLVIKSESTASPYLYFENFKFDGTIYRDADSAALNITAKFVGKNEIKAPELKSAIDGFNQFKVIGDGEIKIVGGNGTGGSRGNNGDISGKKNPTDGDSGTDGKSAITNTTFIVACEGTVILIGGNGGTGGDGGDVEGESNRSGDPTLPAGGKGGNGGNGGMPINLSLLTVENCGTLQLQYGNGGDGGKGGKGGDALEVTDVIPDHGGDGGKGGDGGNGYVAGDGGDGGNGGHSFGAATGFLDLDKKRGKSGNGGDGGDGGEKITAIIYSSDNTLEGVYGSGGAGGSYGSKGTLDRGGGVKGIAGENGNDGADGVNDNSYYNSFKEQFYDN